MPAKSTKQLRKEKVWDGIQSYVMKYDKVLFVNVDNVTSKQICVMRKALRAMDAHMIMGKNTLIRTCLKELVDQHKEKAAVVKIITDQMALNTGLIFTNGDLAEVKAILDTQKREAPARIGAIAPADVTVPAGPTGLDPKQTSFFQALKIQTKITKAQVEIITPVVVIKEDDKITPGQAALLDKLKIRPFEYKMHIKCFLDNGKLYPAKVLEISHDSIVEAFSDKAKMLTALSLGSGFVTSSAAPHLIVNAFKHLAAVSFATKYSFPQAEKLKAAAASAPASGGAAAAAPKGGDTKAAAKVEEKEESDDDVDLDMGGMFGEDF